MYHMKHIDTVGIEFYSKYAAKRRGLCKSNAGKRII